MTHEPDWLTAKRIDIQVRMLHLQALAEKLDPDRNSELWLMRALLVGAIYSLWCAMFLLPTADDDFDTTDDAPAARRDAFDRFMADVGENSSQADIDAGNAAYDITNAGARLLVLGMAKGADAALSDKTRMKCAELNRELLMMVESGAADLPVMWGMALHVFDHALADIEAAADSNLHANAGS